MTPEGAEAVSSPASHVWIPQLKSLQNDFDRLRTLARETDNDDRNGLLASATFSCQAREIQGRCVRLFGRVAHMLRSVEGTRNIRSRLLLTSDQIAILFTGGRPATRMLRQHASSAFKQTPAVTELLYTVDGLSPFYDGMSLHDRVLSVAAAAEGALHSWRPEIPFLKIRYRVHPEIVGATPTRWAPTGQAIEYRPLSARTEASE